MEDNYNPIGVSKQEIYFAILLIGLLGTIPRDSEEWKFLYRQRTAVERTNSLLKSPTHKLDEPRVRGMEQIQIHVFLSICALVVKTIGKSGKKKHP